MNLDLNFTGLSVFEFRRCYDFYAGTMGMNTEANQAMDWALLGQSWIMWSASESPSMMTEMFHNNVRPPPHRAWGKGQNLRPSIQVRNLASSIDTLRDRGVEFTGGIHSLPWGDFAEFTTPEDIRWTLSQLHGMPFTTDLRYPRIGLVELKVDDIDAQLEFYVKVMGLRVKQEGDKQILLEHAKKPVLLSLEEGSVPFEYSSGHKESPVLTRPVWISFRTPDVRATARELRQSGVSIVRDVEFHPGWSGTDIQVTDPDGNPMTIAQYTTYNSASKDYPFFENGG